MLKKGKTCALPSGLGNVQVASTLRMWVVTLESLLRNTTPSSTIWHHSPLKTSFKLTLIVSPGIFSGIASNGGNVHHRFHSFLRSLEKIGRGLCTFGVSRELCAANGMVLQTVHPFRLSAKPRRLRSSAIPFASQARRQKAHAP